MEYLPKGGWQRLSVLFFYTAAIILLLLVFVRYLSGPLLPFIIAWLFAFMLDPVIKKLSRRTKLPRKLLSVVIIISALFLLGLVVFSLLERLFYEAGELIEAMSGDADNILQNIFDYFDTITERYPILAVIGDNERITAMAAEALKAAMSSVSSRVPDWIAAFAGALPGAVFFTVILVLAAFYISMDFDRVNRFLMRQLPPKLQRLASGIREQLSSAGFKYLRAYLAILCVTFAQLLTGFLILRLEYAFLLAAVIALLDILPVIGVGTILIPWALILLLGGNYYTGIGLLIIFAAVSLIRQIIEPKIVGISIGLHPLATLIAMYAGFKLGGLTGMIVFPIIAIILKNLNDSGVLRFYRPPDKDEKTGPPSSGHAAGQRKEVSSADTGPSPRSHMRTHI